jgi:hypothetical protein
LRLDDAGRHGEHLLVRPALSVGLIITSGVFSQAALGVEVTARLGLASPMTSGVLVGPAVGLSLGVPIKGRLGVLASGDFSTHALSGHPDARIDALTGALGLEASIDLAPVIPTLSIGGAYQHAWRQDVDAHADKFGGFIGVGLRATLLDHLRLGLQARYFTTSFGGSDFPAYVTFSLEVGWTS